MHAAFAFYRIGHSHLTQSILEPDFALLMSCRMYGLALYAASVLAGAAISAGDFEAAERWFSQSQHALRGDAAHRLNPNAGYGANAGALAMRQGRYAEAREYFLAPLRHYTILEGARYRGVMLSYILRIQQLSSGTNLSRGELDELRELYDKGKQLGGQDTLVEALWCALILEGDATAANQLLRDFLLVHRRERSIPEWSLRHATAADDAWLEYRERFSVNE
jgi:hypothetical protein